jgi:hypothetical protein
MTATNISGMGWTCALATLSCTRSDPLAGFASYPAITVPVSVALDAPGGVTNSSSVSGSGAATTGSNTATDFTTTFTPNQVTKTWSLPSHPAPFSGANAALLMTDGSVMVQRDCTGSWYRLAPDSFGNYINGTWSQVAPMQPGYGPHAFSSAVLADGRLVVIGGEYNSSGANNNACTSAETNLGAIYDPITNIWTPLSAPSGWTQIGDASNVVLPDGQFLLADNFGTIPARLDPVTLKWTILNAGLGASEAGWTLLPDGTVLMATIDGKSYRYFPQTDSGS